MRIVNDGGRITADMPLNRAVPCPSRLALPTQSHAHDHARTIRIATLSAYEQELESWVPAHPGRAAGHGPYPSTVALSIFMRQMLKADGSCQDTVNG